MVKPFIIEEGPYKGWPTYEYAKKKMHPKIEQASTVKELFEARAEVSGDKKYLVYAPTMEEYTYDEMNRWANRIAYALAELGVNKGDRVALFLRNAPHYIACMHGVYKLGAIEVPVNWFFRRMEAKYVIGNSGAKVVVAEPDLVDVVADIRGELPELKYVITTGDEQGRADYTLKELTEAKPEHNPDTKISPDDPVSIIYTSGTTGLPKGALLTHKSFVLSAKAITLWPFDENSVDYTGLPLFHVNAKIYSSLGTAVAGGVLALSDRWSPQKFWHEVTATKATHFNLLGSMINILYALTEKPEESVAKYVIIGGTPKELWKPFEEKFDMTILEGYSQTEDPLPFLNPPGPYAKVGSFGVPVFPDLGHEVKVVDEQGNEVEPGKPGELIRRSPATFQGYWRDPGKTSEALRDGWLYSGDIVFADRDGYFYFVDRKKFVIRKSGENISSWEIEDVLKKHPKIADAVVVPVKDPFKGEEVKAIVLPKQGEEVKPEEVIEWVAKHLAYFKVPRYVEIVDSLPYGPTGRPLKWKLIEREKSLEDHGWDRDKHMPDWRKRFYGS